MESKIEIDFESWLFTIVHADEETEDIYEVKNTATKYGMLCESISSLLKDMKGDFSDEFVEISWRIKEKDLVDSSNAKSYDDLKNFLAEYILGLP